ncbi:hypothetical protein NMYAN_30004 [Nitrosomonas nitrosa]|uniref:Uncharacterized protein n=1 Tax=Nitrosomonas nitrosa TaxID=52442 RepID=A0A8H9D9Q0_9PROT|nr:hypothetical protein NMYAN_30004 [Nitrosomonas nitrosa]
MLLSKADFHLLFFTVPVIAVPFRLGISIHIKVKLRNGVNNFSYSWLC